MLVKTLSLCKAEPLIGLESKFITKTAISPHALRQSLKWAVCVVLQIHVIFLCHAHQSEVKEKQHVSDMRVFEGSDANDVHQQKSYCLFMEQPPLHEKTCFSIKSSTTGSCMCSEEKASSRWCSKLQYQSRLRQNFSWNGLKKALQTI